MYLVGYYMESDKKEEAKRGYIADYTLGVYLSGIIILTLSIIGIIVILRIPYEAYAKYPDLMLDLLFGGFVGVILALLFLLIRRKIIYLLFLGFLIIGLISKLFWLHWLWTITGRFGGGFASGIGLQLLIIIYLALKYKSVFVPIEKGKEKFEKRTKNQKEEPSRILYFLLPVFFGIVGGLIGFFDLKNRNWKMAMIVLGLGIVTSVVGAYSFIALTQPKPITCNNPTDNFVSGCKLLLHYDEDKDGIISVKELNKAYDDWVNRTITEEEFDFVSDAYINDDLNVVCPDCFEGAKNKANQKVRALAQESQCDWTGAWNTTFGKMRLFQGGDLVVGDYEYRDGKIVGKISGYTLMGTWFEGPSYSPPNSAGDFEFTILPDCDSFTGRWRFDSTGNWGSWTGKRITSILTFVDSDGDEVPDQYDYAPYDPNVQSRNDIKAPEVLIDTDNDGVPDQYDYAPRDPHVQTKSDIKTPGFEAIFTIVGLLVGVYLLSRRK